jgi:hypothetical protein
VGSRGGKAISSSNCRGKDHLGPGAPLSNCGPCRRGFCIVIMGTGRALDLSVVPVHLCKRPTMDAIPNTVHKGIRVCDIAMDDIGSVETFRLSDEDPSQPGEETVGISPVVEEEPGTLTFADELTPDDRLPRSMRERPFGRASCGWMQRACSLRTATLSQNILIAWRATGSCCRCANRICSKFRATPPSGWRYCCPVSAHGLQVAGCVPPDGQPVSRTLSPPAQGRNRQGMDTTGPSC